MLGQPIYSGWERQTKFGAERPDRLLSLWITRRDAQEKPFEPPGGDDHHRARFRGADVCKAMRDATW